MFKINHVNAQMNSNKTGNIIYKHLLVVHLLFENFPQRFRRKTECTQEHNAKKVAAGRDQALLKLVRFEKLNPNGVFPINDPQPK